MMRAHQGISIRPNRHDVYLTNVESLAKKLESYFFLYIISLRKIYLLLMYIQSRSFCQRQIIFSRKSSFYIFLNCFDGYVLQRRIRRSTEEAPLVAAEQEILNIEHDALSSSAPAHHRHQLELCDDVC